MSHTQSLTVVVLNWNTSRLTLKCVASVLAGECVPRILVVDNGSRDDDRDVLRSGLPREVDLLFLQRNAGFAGGMNAGIEYELQRRTDYVWCLNSDCEVVPTACGRLLNFLVQSSGPSLVSPAVRGWDNTPDHVGGVLDLSSSSNCLVRGESELMTGGGSRAWLSGVGLALDARVLRLVGAFDERLFAYWEDVDLSFRSVDAGIPLRVCHDAVIIHQGSLSSGGRHSRVSEYLTARNLFLILRRYAPAGGRSSSVRNAAARLIRRAGLHYRRGERDASSATIRGVWRGFLGEVGPPPRHWPTFPWNIVARYPWRISNLCAPKWTSGEDRLS